jgi:predicted nuclease with TOPRIM domain
MKQKEITERLRVEIGHLEVAIKKATERCERLKQFVLDLEAEVETAEKKPQPLAEDSKFRKAIDAVFGEKPKSKRK